MPNRDGRRKKRSEREPYKSTDLGFYCIFTDTKETEENYFDGLKISLPESIRERIEIKVFSKIKTEKLLESAQEVITQSSQYYQPWIVFDRDRVKNFDIIISNAEKAGIKVAWSNPCLEIWFLAYLGSMPVIESSVECCKKFAEKYERETGHKYKKSDSDIYFKLKKFGDENNAIACAEKRYAQIQRDSDCRMQPSTMISCTTIHILVKEIKSKAKL